MRTSINIRKNEIRKLTDICEKSGLSRSQIISRCLIRLFLLQPNFLVVSRICRLVNYQPRGIGYQIMNVDFNSEVYNLGVNFRVFSRISVSMMVTVALLLFLDKILDNPNKEKKPLHNYLHYYHKKRHNITIGRLYYNVMWDISDNTQKYLRYKQKE